MKKKIKNFIFKLLRIDFFEDHYFINNLKKDSIILDLGAGGTEAPDKILKKYPTCRIILIEAHPHLCEELTLKFKNGHNIEIFNAAIGGQSKDSVKFYLSDSWRFNSIYKHLSKMGGELRNDQCEINVRMVTLGDIFRLFKIRKIDLLKVDIEGAELDLFENFSQYDSERISQITVEFHDFLDPALRRRVEQCIKKLQGLGYVFIDTNWRASKRYINCLFCNKKQMSWAMSLKWTLIRYIVDSINHALSLILQVTR